MIPVLALLVASGCGDDGTQTGTGTSTETGIETGTETGTETGANSTQVSSADDSSSSGGEPGADDSSSSESSSETTAGVPDCPSGEPTVLYSSAENIGAIAHPASPVFLWGMQSWYHAASGEIAESADDFDVPESTCWCITSVNVIGQFVGTPADPMFDVRFYDDVAGLPAESPWLADTHGPTSITPVRIDADFPIPVSHVIEFAAPVLVEAGRAWVSMIGHVTMPGTFSMNLSTDQFGLSTVYRREGTCPQWQHLEDCLPDYPPAELAFELLGHAVACE